MGTVMLSRFTRGSLAVSICLHVKPSTCVEIIYNGSGAAKHVELSNRTDMLSWSGRKQAPEGEVASRRSILKRR